MPLIIASKSKFNRCARKAANLAAFVLLSVSGMGSAAMAHGNANENEGQKGICAKTSDRQDMSRKIPDIVQYFDAVQSFPITGQPIANAVQKPENNITTCVITRGKDTTPGVYSEGVVTVEQGSYITTPFHEFYHALADLKRTLYPLIGKSLVNPDAAFATLLNEASATAYEMAMVKEAANKGLTIPQEEGFSSSKPANIAAFNKAYDQAWKDNAKLDAQSREAKALEAGGKAVVRRLVSGAEAGWSSSTIRNALDILTKLDIPKDGRQNQPGYGQRRDEIYKRIGNVVPRLNFVPEEYTGPNASQTIVDSLQKTVAAVNAAAQANKDNAPKR